MRWEDCVKRDVTKTGEEGDWKKKTGDRGGWRRITDEAVKKLQASHHPGLDKGKKRDVVYRIIAQQCKRKHMLASTPR